MAGIFIVSFVTFPVFPQTEILQSRDITLTILSRALARIWYGTDWKSLCQPI
jgi:hypothetical protein